MKQVENKHRTDREFKAWDYVYLKLQPYSQSSVALRTQFKLNPWFYGPYKVLQKIGSIVHKLELPEDVIVHLAFHVSLLKKKLSEKEVTTTTLPTMDHAGRVKIVPVAILDKKLIKRDKRAVVMGLVQ